VGQDAILRGGCQPPPGRSTIGPQVAFSQPAPHRIPEIILASEMYQTNASAMNGVESVKKNAASSDRYDRFVSKNGKFYFTLKAGNQQVIGTSEMYASEAARDHGIESVMKTAPGAEIVTLAGV
jgi:uncharacterized protein YegP (UPF0339 family)